MAGQLGMVPGAATPARSQTMKPADRNDLDALILMAIGAAIVLFLI